MTQQKRTALLPSLALLAPLLALPVQAAPDWRQALPWSGQVPQAYGPSSPAPGRAPVDPPASPRSALVWSGQMPWAYPSGARSGRGDRAGQADFRHLIWSRQWPLAYGHRPSAQARAGDLTARRGERAPAASATR